MQVQANDTEAGEDKHSSLSFWQKHIDATIFDEAAMHALARNIAQVESLFANQQYSEARALYHSSYNEYRKKLEWFRGREQVWQSLPARLVRDKHRASYGLAVLFADSNIAMIRHRLDHGQSYSGIEDYFQELPARHTPGKIMRKSDKSGDGDQSKTFGMLSYYVGYEIARIAEQEFSRHSANEGGLDRVSLLMGWRDYIRSEAVRVSEEETWGILGAMSQNNCQ